MLMSQSDANPLLGRLVSRRISKGILDQVATIEESRVVHAFILHMPFPDIDDSLIFDAEVERIHITLTFNLFPRQDEEETSFRNT